MMPPPPPPELFAERPVRSDFADRGGPSYAVRRMITLAVLGLVIGGGAYMAYSRAHPSRPAAIPTVAADTNYKTKPEQPGGIDIPHRDVEVYHELDDSAGHADKVEHLLPPPEVPQLPPVTPAPSSAPAAASSASSAPAVSSAPPAVSVKVENLLLPETPAPKTDTTVTPPASATTAAPTLASPAPAPASIPAPVSTSAPPAPPATPAPAPAAPAPVSAPAPAAPPVAAMAQATRSATKEPVAKPLAAAAASPKTPTGRKGGVAIQLASIPNEADARRSMAHLQSKYAAMLGGAKLRLVRADLGAKGIYYRIQSQPLPDQQALRVCSAIKGHNAGCILVRQ